jgi:transposase
MTDNRSLLKLMPEQREDLQRWAQSRTLPAGDVFRARLILALADGTTYREIARSLKTSLPTIARWKMRFERDGLAGLEGRHLGSKPRAATPKVQARVIRRVQQKPGDGSTHWSCRKLASELALSKSTVQRILAQAQLKPHRLERYMASNDPDFESKAADIIGLYLHPPQHAAVFCLDEKTAIQVISLLWSGPTSIVTFGPTLTDRSAYPVCEADGEGDGQETQGGAIGTDQAGTCAWGRFDSCGGEEVGCAPADGAASAGEFDSAGAQTGSTEQTQVGAGNGVH